MAISHEDRKECLRLAIRLVSIVREDRSQIAYLVDVLEGMEARIKLRGPTRNRPAQYLR